MRNRLNLDPVRNLNQLSPAMRFGAYQMTIPTSRSTITEEIRLETPSLKDRTYTRTGLHPMLHGFSQRSPKNRRMTSGPQMCPKWSFARN